MLILLSSNAFPAKFNYKDIDVLTWIMLGQATGLSKIELETLALAEFRFDKEKQKLTMVYCWKREFGVGRFVQEIWASNKLEENAIVFLLLKLELMGVIKSAIQVYNGDEELIPSSNEYESAELLQAKLNSASRQLTNGQLQAFTEGNVEPPQDLMKQVIKSEKPYTPDSPDYRLPCWLSIRKGSATSKRMPSSTANGKISTFICYSRDNAENHHGYQSSDKKKIGATSTQKAYRNKISGFETFPLYQVDGYTVKDHVFFDDSLPTPEQFLNEQSS